MKKAFVLAAAVFIIQIVFCSCAPANGQPAEPAAKTVSQPAVEETSIRDGSLYFQLSDLPKIGSYYGGTVYRRITEDYVNSFHPSDQYGAVVPYLGDYRTYTFEEYDGTVSSYQCPHYGLMTTDGTVITDAVYDDAYTDSGLIVLYKWTMDREGYEIENCTIVPGSGKWRIEVDWFNKGEGYAIFCSVSNDRIYVCDGESLSGYDFNGKKLFTVQKRYIRCELVEKTGCILMNDSTADGKDVAAMLDKNGKELWSLEAQYLSAGTESSKYFPCCEVQGTDGGHSSCGILDQNGEWVVQPLYRRTQVFGDKYFVCDDGYQLMILDKNLETVACLDGSGLDAPDIKWFNGELLYGVYDYETGNRVYYPISGEPITVKGKTMVVSRPVNNTKVYFGIDTDGVGYFFTRDGAVKKTFSYAVDFDWGLNDDQFAVITGNDQKRVAHIIDINTLTEKFSYVCQDEDGKVKIYRGTDNRDGAARHFYLYLDDECNNGEVEYRAYQVINAETGGTVVDGCDEVNVFVVNGKEYCSYVKDNTAVVIDETGTVLLRIPGSDLD